MADNARHHVIILQKATRLPPELPEFLHEKNFSSQTVSTVGDVLKGIEKVKNPLVLAYCGNDERVVIRSVDELLNAPSLEQYAMVVLGKGIERHQGRLEQKFPAVLTLAPPFDNKDIVQALNYVADAWIDARKREELLKAEKPVAVPEIVEPAAGAHSQTALVQVQLEVPSVPLVVFEQMQSSGLARIKLGGEKYSTKINPDYLSRNGYLPSDPRAVEAINHTLDQVDKWGKLHLCRTAFVANHLIGPLQVEQGLVQDTRVASFLFASAFTGEKPELLKTNYLRPGKKQYRRDLCSRMKDSALKAASMLGVPRIGEIIAVAARLIGKEEQPQDDEITLSASSIMAADLADRVCFQNGFWDPRSAYGLLRRIKAGELSDIHKRVMCCMVKFISEAVANKPCAFLVPKNLRDNPELLAAANAARRAVAGKQEQPVPISSLEPGMKLARPLVAFDGREILGSDLVLDQDLIWRIWQLAAMRPLNTPLIVRSED